MKFWSTFCSCITLSNYFYSQSQYEKKREEIKCRISPEYHKATTRWWQTSNSSLQVEQNTPMLLNKAYCLSGQTLHEIYSSDITTIILYWDQLNTYLTFQPKTNINHIHTAKFTIMKILNYSKKYTQF